MEKVLSGLIVDSAGSWSMKEWFSTFEFHHTSKTATPVTMKEAATNPPCQSRCPQCIFRFKKLLGDGKYRACEPTPAFAGVEAQLRVTQYGGVTQKCLPLREFCRFFGES